MVIFILFPSQPPTLYHLTKILAITIPEAFLGYPARPIVSREYDLHWSIQDDTNGIKPITPEGAKNLDFAAMTATSQQNPITTPPPEPSLVALASLTAGPTFSALSDTVHGAEVNCFGYQQSSAGQTSCDCGSTKIAAITENGHTSCDLKGKKVEMATWSNGASASAGAASGSAAAASATGVSLATGLCDSKYVNTDPNKCTENCSGGKCTATNYGSGGNPLWYYTCGSCPK